MSAGKCPKCDKEFKNLGSHSKYCKVAMKQGTHSTSPTPNPIQAPAEPTIHIKQDLGCGMKLSWYNRLFKKKQSKEKKKLTTGEMLDNLPKWSIKAKKPWGKPKNKNASWIQIIAFSRTRPPKAVWAEYDGVSVSVDDMFFPAPHDIRGEIFPYDMDKGIPLLDNSDQYNDMSYWNKLVERVKNMYFTLGMVEGAGDFTKNIGLILLLVGGCLLAVIINIIITYTISKDLASTAGTVGNATTAIQNYINTHP